MRKWGQKLPLLRLYVVGFLIGILWYAWGSHGSGLLSPQRLCELRERLTKICAAGEIGTEAGTLLPYVGFGRVKWLVFTVLAGTTYLSPLVCACTAAWLGVSTGMTLMMVIMQYGLKGMVLGAALLFPQWLIYAPGIYFLLRWCEELYGGIYLKRRFSRRSCLVKLILILFMMTTGIFLESFLGSKALQAVLADF